MLIIISAAINYHVPVQHFWKIINMILGIDMLLSITTDCMKQLHEVSESHTSDI